MEFRESAGDPTLIVPSFILLLSFVPDITNRTLRCAVNSSITDASYEMKFFETSSSVPKDKFQT